MTKSRKKREKYDKNVLRSLALISQFGISMVTPIGLCCAAGYYLDRLLQTNFLFVVLFFLGAAAGFRNIYIVAKRLNEKD